MTPESERRDEKERRERWRYEDALQFVCERYPELKERIVRSLETPQMNDHHMEGKTMESHVRLILESLNDLAEGKFPEELAGDTATQEFMRRSVTVPSADDPQMRVLNPDLVTYAFTHDIAKPDSLYIKLEGEKKGIEMTLEDWKAVAAHGEPYHVDGKRVVNISYYHPSKGSDGQHGNTGAKLLESSAIPEYLLTAIREHESAYSFVKTNALKYQEHFVDSGLSTEEQELAITASYIDTMASLTAEGRPDLRNLLLLIRSRKNYLLIRSFLDRGAKFRENDFRALMKQDRVLSEADVERVRLSDA